VQWTPPASNPQAPIQLAFELRDGEVVVTRAEAEHKDPVIGASLSLLEADIRDRRNIRTLPEELAPAMLANVSHDDDLGQEIEGGVAL
jgi:antitoxin PrlF